MARIQSFREFWPFYVREHSLPTTRLLHYIGTAAATITLFSIIYSGRWYFLPFSFVPGYAGAWVGHFVIEKNRPATFQYPLWSLLADYKMFGLMLTGRMKHEAARYSSQQINNHSVDKIARI